MRAKRAHTTITRSIETLLYMIMMHMERRNMCYLFQYSRSTISKRWAIFGYTAIRFFNELREILGSRNPCWVCIDDVHRACVGEWVCVLFCGQNRTELGLLLCVLRGSDAASCNLILIFLAFWSASSTCWYDDSYLVPQVFPYASGADFEVA